MPVDPADLALKTSTVEKDADSEAIFWTVRVADEAEGWDTRTVLRHYIRIKIFTDRGREAQSKIDIPYLKDQEISDIAARTIKSDGTIVELKKSDIFDRTIVKVSGAKLKQVFCNARYRRGAVIEYRWREIRKNQVHGMTDSTCNAIFPARLVKYYPKTLASSMYGMRAKTFHGDNTAFVKEKDGYYSTTMSNVPAFREEPRMPPENELRAWMLVYYSDKSSVGAQQLYSELGRERYEQYKSSLKVTGEIKNATAEAIADATTPDDKLRRLFDYCRSKIKNIYDDVTGLTPDQRAKMKENKTATDVLKRGFGTSGDIDILFSAMANAAGFEARITKLADRSRYFFDVNSTDDFQLSTYNVAVKVGEEWRFFDPASRNVPFGMLRWQEESQDAAFLIQRRRSL